MSAPRRDLARRRRRADARLEVEFETESFRLWLPDPDDPMVIADVAEAAAQEVDRLPHDLHVLLVRDARVARRQRALDEVLQAGGAAGPPGLGSLALAVREDAPDELRDLTHLAGARVRPEVEGAGHVPAADEAYARPLVAHRDLDEGVALVVAQAEVVLRP